MKMSRMLVLRWFFLGSLVLCGFVFATISVAAQTGDKAVYGTNSNLAASSAWVDASAFCPGGGTNNCSGSGVDFCSVVSQAITELLTVSPVGGVVDARGVLQVPPPQMNAYLPCASNNGSPFPSSITQTNPYPITILLPSYTIELTATWTIPNNVRLVGVGFETNLLGASNCCSQYMIEMGPISPPERQTCPAYTGIAIEHVRLTTQGSYGGIDNECAGAASYVNDVKISAPDEGNLEGNGLTIGLGAINSGPYTDIYVLAAPGASNCGGNYAINCVAVKAQTRGIHGVTCLGNATTGSTQGSAGILVNASNNSIEDVHVESFYDGIGLSSVGNIFVSNINGGFSGTEEECPSGGVTDAVHVYGSVTGAVIAGISNGPYQPVNSIQDDETGTTISGCEGTGCPNPITSGMYILGSSDTSTGGYSRFAINPANSTVYPHSTIVPTWGMGTSSPNGPPSGACYSLGAIYSYVNSTGGQMYVCTFTNGGTTWLALP